MCGRYVAEEDTDIDLGALYRAVRANYPDVKLKSGEIYPTDTVPLLTGTKLPPPPLPGESPASTVKGLSSTPGLRPLPRSLPSVPPLSGEGVLCPLRVISNGIRPSKSTASHRRIRGSFTWRGCAV